MAAAFLGSGVANAEEGTFYASEYKDGDIIALGTGWEYNTLVVNTPLTMSSYSCLDLYNGATFQFQKKQAAEAICSIFTQAYPDAQPVYFNDSGSVYNITFDEGAQTVVAASAGKAITLIEDLNKESDGFYFWGTFPSETTLKLDGAVAGQTVNMNGVSFTYVGPKASDYTFKAGEIGFTGYEHGSYALNLVVGGSPTPEPTTGTLSLLALAGLCARRRRK